MFITIKQDGFIRTLFTDKDGLPDEDFAPVSQSVEHGWQFGDACYSLLNTFSDKRMHAFIASVLKHLEKGETQGIYGRTNTLIWRFEQELPPCTV